MAVGASASVRVQLVCPIAAPLHTALGYILPLFLLAADVALGGRPWLDLLATV